MIRKKGDEWCLYSATEDKKGKRKNLGCYSSLEGAQNREKQVLKFKHMKKENKTMHIKKSEIYKIIQEELEVVLTNEEAEEMFELDMSALLDEMMSEEEQLDEEELDEKKKEKPFGDLKKGTCTPMGTPKCPEGSPQYNLAKAFKGPIRKSNLKRGKNPHGPG